MNVAVARGSRAEAHFKSMASLPGGAQAEPRAIAPGVSPTPRHNLVFHGGKTIARLTHTNFYLGGTASWHAADIGHIDQALAGAMADRRLNNVMMQYFGNQPITSSFKPSKVLSTHKAASFSQGDVEQLVRQMHKDNQLAGFDLANTVFNFMLPHGTVLTTDTAPTKPAARSAAENPAKPESDDSSLEGLGGYHGSVHVSAAVTVYYAIGVYSERRSDGSENGIVAFDQPWKNIVATFYHELCEARTDPDVEDAILAGNDPKAVKFLGWMSRQGEECGDFPMSEVGASLSLIMQEVALADGSGKVPVQFQYSNAVGGPEGPIEKPHPAPAH